MQILVYRGEVSLKLGCSSLSPLTDFEVLRDVSERGRDIQGVIKQWFSFVKPNFEKFVDPQRKVAGNIAFSNRWIRLSKV